MPSLPNRIVEKKNHSRVTEDQILPNRVDEGLNSTAEKQAPLVESLIEVPILCRSHSENLTSWFFPNTDASVC
jgi:hypothetical protein